MSKKRTAGKFILMVAAMAVAAQIVHSAGAMLTMNYYKDPQYFPVWSKLMMPGGGSPPGSFYLYSFLFGMVQWGVFLALFRMVKNWIPGRSPVSNGLVFGAGVFLVGGFAQFLSLGLLINLPFALVLFWAMETLVIDLINGALAGRLWRRIGD